MYYTYVTWVAVDAEREGQRECRGVYNINTQQGRMYIYSNDLSVDCVSVHPTTFLNGVEFGEVGIVPA